MRVSINDFYIESDFREEQEGIGELAASIDATGLINPITVQEVEGRFEILAGRRRFIAIKEFLKLEELEEGIHFLRRENVNPYVIQLEENLNRSDFKPIEVAKLIHHIHTEQIKKHKSAVRGVEGGWSVKDTGQLIRRNATFVSRCLSIYKHRADVEHCTKLTDALDIIKKKKKKAIEQVISAEKVKRAEQQIDTKKIWKFMENFANANAIDYLKTLEDQSIDLVMTDPPYGIKLNEVAGGAAYDVYSDKFDDIYKLLSDVVPELFRVLTPGGYCIIWTSFTMYDKLLKLMRAAGFFVDTTPLVWTKLNASGLSMNPKQTLGSVCEIAAYGWKESFSELAIHGRGNVFPYKIVRTDRIHVAQKPEELISDVLNIFSQAGDRVLDIFAGSGSTMRSCFLGKRNFFGCELDEVNFVKAKDYTISWFKELTDVGKQ